MCEAEQEMWEAIVENDPDPDRRLDDRPADEQLADRATEWERFSVEGLRELEADEYPNGKFCHRLPECRGRSSCPRDIACNH